MEANDLHTPYRRRTISGDIIDDNTDKYRMFALKTHMWPILSDGEYVAYRSVEYGNDLWVCMNIMQSGERVVLPEYRYNKLQSFITSFLNQTIQSVWCI